MKKKYEITGVIEYAHCISFQVRATSIIGAKRVAKKMAKMLIDPASAEYQTTLIDEPVEIK